MWLPEKKGQGVLDSHTANALGRDARIMHELRGWRGQKPKNFPCWAGHGFGPKGGYRHEAAKSEWSQNPRKITVAHKLQSGRWLSPDDWHGRLLQRHCVKIGCNRAAVPRRIQLR